MYVTSISFLCGLKQAPHAWYTRFSQSKFDPSLFILGRGSNMAYLLLYVDDISLTASALALLDIIIAELGKYLQLIDLGK
ncbi:Retrovirus-related Pol polyprotein from transposon RE1 [Cardamine amara subsp. amara]|uniref:Retrovirus-related Pol polyprotein from transposon RE1 n=1 Tax=Cardamine amara subsp. amara TaxID=228776 RepID=A0ABD1B1T1_CARAN